ncbi:MAG: Dot/Icm type IV secretion system effector CoxH3 [Gammaproteobacteria bacterium]|nr:MAG: Dot/Icm type IV secretion system effector CoxH3 [Gammaproteobacteria bacterium]
MPLTQLEFNQQNTATTFITGLAGNIEVLITRPKELTESTPIAVISHPHPLYGGSMTNKVVHIMAKSFSELDAITVRFNFRGVGQSQGEYSDGLGEAEDLQALVSELKRWRPQASIWLAGFSFGAYVTVRAQAAIKPEKLLLVAPPVSMYSFDELAEVNIPWIVIQGGQDEVIDAAAVKNWVSLRPNPPQLIWMEQAGHFFHGKLNELKESLLKAWLL